jgi:hypothetical protein
MKRLRRWADTLRAMPPRQQAGALLGAGISLLLIALVIGS